VELRQLDRITFNPAVMGGKPRIRGMRVTVGMIVGMVASTASRLVRGHRYQNPSPRRLKKRK